MDNPNHVVKAANQANQTVKAAQRVSIFQEAVESKRDKETGLVDLVEVVNVLAESEAVLYEDIRNLARHASHVRYVQNISLDMRMSQEP